MEYRVHLRIRSTQAVTINRKETDMNDIVLTKRQACLFYSNGGCGCMPSRACDGCSNTIATIDMVSETKPSVDFQEVGENFDDSSLPFAEERLTF